jgi:hypothetical protein
VIITSAPACRWLDSWHKTKALSGCLMSPLWWWWGNQLATKKTCAHMIMHGGIGVKCLMDGKKLNSDIPIHAHVCMCLYACQGVRSQARTRVLSISFIFSFSPLHRWATAVPLVHTYLHTCVSLIFTNSARYLKVHKSYDRLKIN